MPQPTPSPAHPDLAEFLRPMLAAGSILDRATIMPWIIAGSYARPDGSIEQYIVVEHALLTEQPDPAQYLPVGVVEHSADVFPATRFDDMPPLVRARYRRHYRAYLLARKARAMGKAAADMVPWSDYDPIAIDEAAERWACSTRYAGD